MKISAWRQHTDFLLFALIGVMNTFVHGAILLWAVETLHLHLLFAHALAFWVANLLSYIVNSRITFKMPLGILRYARFLLASLVALGLTLCIAWVTSHMGLHYQLGFAIIVITVPLFSFAAIKFWAFAGHRSTPSHRV